MSVTVAIEPVLVDREVAAEMMGMSLRHFQDTVQKEIGIVRSGAKRLVPVAELKRWAAERAHRG